MLQCLPYHSLQLRRSSARLCDDRTLCVNLRLQLIVTRQQRLNGRNVLAVVVGGQRVLHLV